MTLTPAQFNAFRDLAYREAGISLRDGKEELVATRIARRMRILGLASSAEYLDVLVKDESGAEVVQFIDAISTNFTSFYREPEHFAVLTQHLRAMVASGSRRARLWCAAAATGEEPWTLALTMASVFEGTTVDWKILATDISTRALAAATAARYTARQIAQVPPGLKSRWFSPSEEKGDGEPMFAVNDALKSYVLFRRLNLARPPFPLNGGLDAVFCRNVMIYFDQPVREALVQEVERQLRPGGLFVIGHSETLNGVRSGFTMIAPAVYRKPERPCAR